MLDKKEEERDKKLNEKRNIEVLSVSEQRSALDRFQKKKA